LLGNFIGLICVVSFIKLFYLLEGFAFLLVTKKTFSSFRHNLPSSVRDRIFSPREKTTHRRNSLFRSINQSGDIKDGARLAGAARLSDGCSGLDADG